MNNKVTFLFNGTVDGGAATLRCHWHTVKFEGSYMTVEQAEAEAQKWAATIAGPGVKASCLFNWRIL